MSRIVAPLSCEFGDNYWEQQYRSAIVEPLLTCRRPIYDVARNLLEQLDPGCRLDMLRCGFKSPKIVALRRNLIASLRALGYSGTEISRFLGISTTTVSKVAVSLRT